MKGIAKRAALAVLAGGLASAAAWAVLTDEERAMVQEMHDAAAAIEAGGQDLLANPGLERHLKDEAFRIAQGGREMRESLAGILGEE